MLSHATRLQHGCGEKSDCRGQQKPIHVGGREPWSIRNAFSLFSIRSRGVSRSSAVSMTVGASSGSATAGVSTGRSPPAGASCACSPTSGASSSSSSKTFLSSSQSCRLTLWAHVLLLVRTEPCSGTMAQWVGNNRPAWKSAIAIS